MSAITCCVTDKKSDVLCANVGTSEGRFACADDDNRAIVSREIIKSNRRNKFSSRCVEVARDCGFADGMRLDCILPVDRAIRTVQYLSRK